MNTSAESTQRLKASLGQELMINTELSRIFHWVIYIFLCQLIDIFGAVTNIINIICFVKQGFKEAINVSFFGLAISDLACVATLIFPNLCFSPMFEDLDVPFEPLELQYLVSGWPHVVFSRITCWITALITLERCLCITMPLQVKSMITPKRVGISVASLSIVLIFCGSPLYFANGLGWKFSSIRNRTTLGLVVTPLRDRVDKLSFVINNIFLPYGAFLVVISCTITLIVNIKSKVAWRKLTTVSEQAQMTSNRDQRVARMVVVISMQFIVCFFPVCLMFIAMVLVPGLSVDGKYKDLFSLICMLGVILESSNSALNIFIYYHMSSKYRSAFCQLFRRCRKVGNEV